MQRTQIHVSMSTPKKQSFADVAQQYGLSAGDAMRMYINQCIKSHKLLAMNEASSAIIPQVNSHTDQAVDSAYHKIAKLIKAKE